MKPSTIEKFETGTKDVEILLVKWSDEQLGVMVTDGSSNFTSFDVQDENEGRMRARFLADRFRALMRRKSWR